MKARHSAASIADLLSAHRFRFTSEAELQAGIARVLEAHYIPYRREAALSAQDRPDFTLDGGLVIEVKTQGSTAELTRQIHRYAKHAEVTAILVVTSRMQHRAIGVGEINGKPVRVLHLDRSVL